MEPSIAALRSFVAVAEELHFTRAAHRLGTSTAALSQQVARLELRVGSPLLTRTTRAVQLTEAGQELLPLARETIDAFNRVAGWQREQARGEGGSVVIGFINLLTGPVTTPAIGMVHRGRPDIDVHLRPVSSEDAVRAVLNRDVDAALIRGHAAARGVDQITVWSEPRVVVLRRDHPLAGAASLTWTEIASLPMIHGPHGGELCLGELAEDHPFPDDLPPAAASVRTVEELLAMVRLGRGIVVCGRSVFQTLVNPGLLCVPLRGSKMSVVSWVTRSTGSRPPTRRMTDALRRTSTGRAPA